VQATAHGLARRGHQVVVVAPGAAGEPRVSNADGVELHRSMRRGPLPQTLTDVYETRRSVRAIKAPPFDVVLAHHVGSVAGVLTLPAMRPVAFVFHASPFLEARHRRASGLGAVDHARSLGVEQPLRLLERVALKRAQRILVLSEFSRRLVLQLDPAAASRTRVVGGGVDRRFFAPAADRDALRARLGVQPQERLLLTARRLVPRMGVEILLGAFGDLAARDARLRLVVIGDGELREHLESRRNELGLSATVSFEGRVSDTRLRDWYQAADLFVLPTVAYEGFGMVTAEALSCGTPVVGTRVGANPELLEPLNAVLLADAPTVSSLAATIERVLPQATKACRGLCEEYAERTLAWESVLVRWEAALQELASAR